MNCNGKGLYIHIPFCVKKCGYCDFFSLEGQCDSVKKRYTKRIVEELSNINERVETVFIGGGTPSCLPLQLLSEIVKACPVLENGEFTVEVNPGTVDRKYLDGLRKAGVNRLSIGVQTLSDEELKVLGRIHTVSEFLNCYRWAREVGFENINIDLMFAFPEQTLSSFKETLNRVIELNPEHISCYALMVEEGTPFYEAGVREVDGEADRALYHLAVETLEANGYQRYETSNFAREGYECKHNLHYWHAGEYYGIGAAAHSFIDGIRRYYPDELSYFLKKNPPLVSEVLSKEEKMSELAILMLRLTKGVDKSLFYERFGKPFDQIFKQPICKWEKEGLLVSEEQFCYLTDRGMDLANSVLCDFLL